MLTLREATADDVSIVLQLIRELAIYEREPDAVVATEADLLRDGFGERPAFQVLLAEWSSAPVGFAFYFFNYSTWVGRRGLYLEDLFVRPEARGRGIGKALLVRLAQIAAQAGCARMSWAVLDWNTPAREFYRSIGAQELPAWMTVRLDAGAIARLAQGRVT